jgi:ribosome-associated translation inhibitor RaiA
MRIDIQGLGFPLTAALVEHTERRLRFALTRCIDQISRVVVRLGDTNGPRGGEDKFCKIHVVLRHAPPVLIEDAGADLYAVIDRAAERAGRNVARRIGRLQEIDRLTKREPLRSPPDEPSDPSSNPKGD